MSDVVITASNIGKLYTLKHQVAAGRSSYKRFSEAVMDAPKGALTRWKRFLHRRPNSGRELKGSLATEEFWALKNVDFTINRGDVVGIIGRNGAGKSTLLKILSRITEPTTGRIEIEGRVASLLEVGTGFHPELTGRENIFLNGAILGMSRVEIRRKFDEIVAFAEVEAFLDTPVKRYSSGMYVRLAFAVAAHLEPEILIVDEVLAVGDIQFQRKCLGKMQDVSAQGRTVLFVSHNMAAINRLCRRGILLERGTIKTVGSASAVVAQYVQAGSGEATLFAPKEADMSDRAAVRLLSACVRGTAGGLGPDFGSDESLRIEIAYQVCKSTPGIRVGFHLHGPDGTIIFNAADTDQDHAANRVRPEGVYTSTCIIPGDFLNRGQYFVTVGSDIPPTGLNFYFENAMAFFIIPNGSTAMHQDNRPGLIYPNFKWVITEDKPAT